MQRSRHLSFDEIVDFRDRCPICHGREKRTRRFTLQRNPTIELLHCPNCRAHSSSHMPSPEWLQAYYEHYYDGSERTSTFYNTGRLARHVVRLLPEAETERKLAALDFGGGDGSLSMAIAESLRPSRRLDVTLVDLNPARKLFSDRSHFRSLGALERAMDSRYWLVLASAVLEHVPDLSVTLTRLLDLLEPGGYFYARTPYRVPLKRLVPFLSLDFPAHVHDLGPSFWSRVPARHPRVELIHSRPSVVASGFRPRSLGRTLAAHSLKAPAFLEAWVRREPRDYYWPFVGGWEVVIRRRAIE